MPIKEIVIFIVGPTAIGKTAIAVKLARKINGEIISADSMQAYKGMPILSQAPGKDERKGVPHHLINFLSPTKEYNAAKFIKKSAGLIASIIKKGKIPIVAGGSGLYVRALIDGLFPSPAADLKFRRRMGEFTAKYGSAKLHKKLTRIDPDASGKIHPNDKRRIIRALEIYESTGRTMSELKNETKGIGGRYRIKMYALTAPRDDIYFRINSRVDEMFENGVISEVKKLKSKRLSKTAKKILGFNEIAGYLRGDYDPDTAKELLKMNTRRFAKRQLTWFRADHRIGWFDVSKTKSAKVVIKIIDAMKYGE